MIEDYIPHDLDAEEAVLSSVLAEPGVITEVLPVVSSGDFHRRENRVLYASMCRLWANEKHADPVLLAQDLRAHGEFDQSGGIDYIASLIGAVPSVANVKSYAEVVREMALRRRVMKAATAVSRSAQNKSVEKIMASADVLLTELGGGSGGGFNLMKESIWPAMERIDAISNNDTAARGVLTGFADLDHLLVGFEPGDLVVLAARPSMGKTAFALNIATNLAVSKNTPVAIVSLEMSAEALTMRCIQAEGRVDLQSMRNGSVSPEASGRMAAAAGYLDTAPIYIDDHPKASVPEMGAKLDRMVKGKGVKLVIIDYLQLMSGPGETRVQEVSKMTRDLKLMAGNLGVPVLVMSQLSRAVEARSDKKPHLSDLRDSGSIEQDADVVMFVYRPEYYARGEAEIEPVRGLAEVIVAKQRNGPVGTASLHFSKEYARFDNLDRGYLRST